MSAEKIDMDALAKLAIRWLEREEPSSWYDSGSDLTDNYDDDRFISESSPSVVLNLIRYIRDLEAELIYAATICTASGVAMASVKHWRELLAKGTTR